MEMWIWLAACYEEGKLTKESMQRAMSNDAISLEFFADYFPHRNDKIYFVREEVEKFLKYLDTMDKIRDEKQLKLF
jgi:hypothetical protein